MAKKKVVVVGNCQARPIATLLEKMSDEIEVTKVAIVHLLKPEQEDEYQPFFEEADYIIAQLVNNDYPCEFVRTSTMLSKYGAKVVKIINAFSKAHTPYLDNLPKDLRLPNAPFSDYHFPMVLKYWSKGRSEEDCSSALDELYVHGESSHVVLDDLKNRERSADVTISDFIYSSENRLFHTFNHPKNELMIVYSKRILSFLGIDSNIDLYEPNEHLGQFVPFFEYEKEWKHKCLIKGEAVYKSTLELVKDFYLFYSENYSLLEGVMLFENIPKVIVQYWGSSQVPEEINSLMCSWKTQNPDFQHVLFNEDSALKFIRDNYGERGEAVFKKAKLPAMQSDIFRVAYCLKKGGLYIDAATKCIEPIKHLFEAKEELTVIRKWHGGIWNGFVLSPPNNVVLGNIWADIVHNVESEVCNDVWKVTGPGVFNKHCEDNKNVIVLDQLEVKKNFLLVNELKHKKTNHWSTKQKHESIFSNNDYFGTDLPRVIVHLGPHKTGTTSFQNILEANEGKLNDRHIKLITVRSECSTVYKELRIKYTKVLQGALMGNSHEEKNTVERLSSILKEIVTSVSSEETKLVLICDENLLGPPTGHYFAGGKSRELGFYSLRKEIFKSIRQAFGEKLYKVMLTDRGHRGFLSSSYKDFISKLTYAQTIEEFNQDVSKGFESEYSNFFSDAKNTFGSKMEIVEFTEFCSNMSDYVSELTKLEVSELNHDSKKSNVSLSERGLKMAMKVIPLLETEQERLFFKRFLMKIR
ncbi:TPA: hypothetical protein NJ228_002423 [Vibrio parahaemolyticus]|nr:hypothetical protein [Vibrio parahaemolyticus]